MNLEKQPLALPFFLFDTNIDFFGVSTILIVKITRLLNHRCNGFNWYRDERKRVLSNLVKIC